MPDSNRGRKIWCQNRKVGLKFYPWDVCERNTKRGRIRGICKKLDFVSLILGLPAFGKVIRLLRGERTPAPVSLRQL